jgi:hypothetical protein
MSKKIRYAGEVFSGLNKPKKTPGKNKKFAVLVNDKKGKHKIVRFGDPKMEHHSEGGKKGSGHGDAHRRKNFRSRHSCDEKKDKTTPGYWSCNYSW